MREYKFIDGTVATWDDADVYHHSHNWQTFRANRFLWKRPVMWKDDGRVGIQLVKSFNAKMPKKSYEPIMVARDAIKKHVIFNPSHFSTERYDWMRIYNRYDEARRPYSFRVSLAKRRWIARTFGYDIEVW